MSESTLLTELPPLHVIPERASLGYSRRFSQSFLDASRTRSDPLADAVVEQLAKDQSLRDYGNLLAETRRRAESEGGIYREFIDACNDVPAWADFEAMRTGQKMIAAFPVHMGLSLFSGSLVGGAVFQKMTLITAMTGMLSGDSTRRLDETAAMVIKMAYPGAVQPGGNGHEVLVRVRLLHGAVRRFLVDKGRFQHPTEQPINQQDLAITLGLFGYLNVRSLGLMGVRFTHEELASYTLLWRYVGHTLGIEDALLPKTIEDQQEFFLASLHHQGKPEKLDPRIKDVMDNLARNATQGRPALYPAASKFLHQGCRYLCGDEYVTGMQIENAGDDFWGLRAMRSIGRSANFVWRHVPGGQDALYRAGMFNYSRALARMQRDKDAKGAYRVRTAKTAMKFEKRSAA